MILLIAILAACPASAKPGRLTGTVSAAPRVAISTDSNDSYGAPRKIRPALFDYDHLKNIVVYAEPDRVGEPTPTSPVDLRVAAARRGLRMTPAFIAITKGGMINVVNETAGKISLYAASAAPGPVSIEIPAHGHAPFRLPAEGHYHLRTLEDAEAESEVAAFGTYSTTAVDGRYSLDLPPGRYRVTAWHPRLPPYSDDVEILEGRRKVLDFILSVKTLPEVLR